MSGPGGVARALNSGTIGRFDDEVENIYSVIRRVCSYYKPVAIQRALRGLISGKRLFCLEVLERVSFKDKISFFENRVQLSALSHVSLQCRAGHLGVCTRLRSQDGVSICPQLIITLVSK